jgi:hypothetical protein
MLGLMAGWVPASICSIEGGGDAGGGAGGAGGAADLVGGAGGGGDAGAGAGGDTGAGAGGAGGEAGAGDDTFLAQFSADGGDADNPSNRDWIKSLGVKDLDGLAKIARDNQVAARSGGLKVPGADAKPEELAAFRKAIGVPESADKYEVPLPEGAEIDKGFVEPMREAALKAGVPAGAFKAMAEGFVKYQLDQVEAEKTRQDGLAQSVLSEWGGQKDAKLADVSSAMRALNLTGADVAAIQGGYGSDKTLNLLQKLGAGMAEDALLGGGGGAKRFGITGAEAQAEITKLSADADFYAKLSAKDPAAVARWDRLNAAVAADRDQKARQAAA